MKTEIPQVIARKKIDLSPWASVTARTIKFPGCLEVENYHALGQADYVSILAITPDGHIPLVRQYRPALEDFSIELPGGLRDNNEPPENSALRELEEETGLRVLSDPFKLGELVPDTGRLENRLWGYFVHVDNVVLPGWQPEPGVEPLMVSKAELRSWIINGKFNHALHIALIGLAIIHGVFQWESI